MCGLVDKHIARNGVQLRGYVGHERTDAAYVLLRRPDILYLGLERIDSLGQVSPMLREFEPQFHNILPYTKVDILGAIAENYEYIKLPGLDGFWCRKDSDCLQYCYSLLGR
jgi:hypothetical protein